MIAKHSKFLIRLVVVFALVPVGNVFASAQSADTIADREPAYDAPFSVALREQADTGYDIVIKNAKIIDGSGNPWFMGDIGIRDERIAKIWHSARCASKASD